MDETIKLRVPVGLIFTAEDKKEVVVDSFSSELKTSSISVETIGLIKNVEPKVNDEIKIEFTLPFEREKIEVTTKIRWIRVENNAKTLLNLSFVDLKNEYRVEIEKYIVNKLKTSKTERKLYSHAEYIERISKYLELTQKANSIQKEITVYGIKVFQHEADIFRGKKEGFAEQESSTIQNCVALRLKLREISKTESAMVELLKDDYNTIILPLVERNLKELENFINTNIKSAKSEKAQKFKDSLNTTQNLNKEIMQLLSKPKEPTVVNKNKSKTVKKNTNGGNRVSGSVSRIKIDESNIKIIVLVVSVAIILIINLGRIASCF